MKLFALQISLFICVTFQAQNGGNSTFQFLNYSNSARVEAAGGYLLTIKDNDASLGVENPSLLNSSMHGFLALNYVNYFANSNYGYSSYTKHYTGIGTFNASLLYANYGKFEYADVSGERNGSTFSANDVALAVAYGRELDSNFSIGADIKFVGSFLETYNAYGISSDIAATYTKKANGFAAAFMIKNLGIQLNTYTSNNRESLPLNILLAFSKKLKHAPFRFSFTAHNLQQWNIMYFDVNEQAASDPLTGETVAVKEPGFVSKAMHHMAIGGELLLSKNFNIQFGYNHKNRKDLSSSIRPGASGISWGFGFKVKKLHVSYGMGKYHIAGTSNHFTISTRIGKPPKTDSFYRQDY
jgi:hypothetical protein